MNSILKNIGIYALPALVLGALAGWLFGRPSKEWRARIDAEKAKQIPAQTGTGPS